MLVSAVIELIFFLLAFYSAVFWILYEKNVDKTLRSQLLLNSAPPESRTVQFPMLSQPTCAQKARREHYQDSCPKLAKGIFHTTEHHAHCINWEELVGSCQSLLWNGLGRGWQVLSNCTVNHPFLGFYSFAPPLFINNIIIKIEMLK